MDPLDLRSIHERVRLRGEAIRARAEWIEARRRELWKRMDRLRAYPGVGAVPVAGSRAHPAAGGLVFPPAASLPPEPTGAAILPVGPRDPSVAAPARGDGGPAGQARPEPVQLDGEAGGSEALREEPIRQVEDEGERQWLRDEVSRMRGDGWSWQELAGIGFGPDLLAELGFEPAAAPRPVDLRDVELDGLRQDFVETDQAH